MNLIFVLLFWLSGQTGALNGADAAADAGRTFGPVFDPSLVNCQTFDDGIEGPDEWMVCITPHDAS